MQVNKDVKLEGQAPDTPQVDEWLKLAQSAFSTSETWMESNLRERWRKNIAMFHSRHPSGSKYHTDQYKYRSKIYRPKTRSSVRKNEAAAVSSMFGSLDVLDVRAEDSGDKEMTHVARFVKNLCQIRLERTIPWFKLAIASFQEANVTGTVISHQGWKYQTETETVEIPVEFDGQPVLDEDGKPLTEQKSYKRTVTDEPEIRLCPRKTFASMLLQTGWTPSIPVPTSSN